MDCNTARLLLAFVRPSNPTETDAAEAEALQQHLDGCAACAALAHDGAAPTTASAVPCRL